MTKKANKPRRDIAEEVTRSILAALERGTMPWRKPWDDGGAPVLPLRASGEAYRGVNVLLLWTAAMERGFSAPTWMTFRQAQELGGQVRKGEKATRVVYYGQAEKRIDADQAEGEGEGDQAETIRFMKAYSVFNADQVDGLPASYAAPAVPVKRCNERVSELDSWVSGTGATIREGLRSAYYAPVQDYIGMPAIDTFEDSERYYSTLAHELSHWTGHPNRLARDYGAKGFGSEGYAKEELVAELSSAFLGAHFGFSPEHIKDHAAYIASWRKAISDNGRFFFQAAAAAQAAADYLLATAEAAQMKAAA